MQQAASCWTLRQCFVALYMCTLVALGSAARAALATALCEVRQQEPADLAETSEAQAVLLPIDAE